MKAFEFFKEISEIPRPSGEEEKIADYLCEFARARGLFCLRDKFNNVFIRRKASAGCENLPSVMLQSHTDMVCESEPGTAHDFTKDKLKLNIEDGRVRAEGTTLGADDGAGVAVMLDILDDKTLTAGEIECLFTSTEETGMEGAFGFDYSVVRSERIINLDSEEELCACVGCAGGRRINAFVPVERIRSEGRQYSLRITGLTGGHSGTDIHLGRQSAIKIMGYLLDRLYSLYPFNIVSFTGGGRDNVIPFSAEAALVFYDDCDVGNARAELSAYAEALKEILCEDDKRNFSVSLRRCESEKTEMLTLKSTSAVISAVMLSPQGVTARTADGGIILASSNLGSLSLDSSLKLGYLLRSDSELRAEQTARVIERMAHALGGITETESSYPGWSFRQGGTLRQAYSRACGEVFGRKPSFTVIHAGLECGVISARLRERGMQPDIISIGPDVSDVHTPKESMDILSLERMGEIVRKILASI